MPTTTTATRTGPRLLPVPDHLPPYDDEASGRRGPDPQGPSGAFVQGTLALTFLLTNGVPATPAPPAGLRLVHRPPDRTREDDGSAGPEEEGEHVEFGPQATARANLPDPRGWAARLAQALVEVLAGDRPPAQLVRWTTTEVYETVTAALPSRRPRWDRPPRALVRSVHVSEPRDGVAEVAAVVRHGVRSTAVALRIEGLDGRWRCTALQLG